MNENLLNALLELIALFARVNNTRFLDNAHNLIKTYIEQTVSINNGRLYARKFFEKLESFKNLHKNTPTDSDSLKNNISEIVSQINSEMKEEERIVLFLSFLELIKLDKKVDNDELSFIEILSSQLHITTTDYKNSLLFILCESAWYGNDVNPDILIISNRDHNNPDQLEGSWIEQNRPLGENQKLLLVKKSLVGEMIILRLHCSHFLVGRYFGNQNVIINNRKVFPEKFFLIDPYSHIRVGNNTLDFQEIIGIFKTNHLHNTLKLVGEDVSLQKKQINFAPFSFCEELGNLVLVISNRAVDSQNIALLLTGQLPLSTGQISFNGYNLVTQKYNIHKMIGLVPRANLFDEHISIFENFYLAANLAFPGFSEQKLSQHVNDTISHLKLNEVSYQPIRNIKSSIPDEYLKMLINTGMETIRDPFVLVVDLPLEKLNSSNTEEFCNILKSETNKGKLVFLISTNPGACILKKTDRMWIFDYGGYLIYRGIANNAVNYFQKINNNLSSSQDICPACGNMNIDQVYQLINTKVLDKFGRPTHVRKLAPREWYNIYKEKIEQSEIRTKSRKVVPSYLSSIPNINIQFFAYLKKSFRSLIANPVKPLLTMAGGFLIALIIAGLLRYDWTENFSFSKHEYLPLLFFLNSVVCFIAGTIMGLQFTADDKLHIAFDYYKNYSFFSYLNVKYLLIILLSVVFSLIFTFITNSITGTLSLFYLNWPVYFSMAFTGACIGLFLGYINLKLRNTLFITAILFSLNMLFSGHILPFNSFPKQIASDKYIPAFAEVLPVRWGYEALVVQQFKDNDYEKNLYKAEQTVSDLTFKTNVLMPKLQESLYNIQKQRKGVSKLQEFYKVLVDINKKYQDIFQFEYLSALEKKQVSIEILTELEDYMRYVQFQLYEKLKEALAQRNEIRQSLKDSLGNERYEILMNQSFNPSLAMFVSGKKQGINYIENNGEIIQTDDPVYRLPESNYGRSHFFAPQKLMNGYYYDTTYFNLFIVGLEVFVIYVLTLVFRNKKIIY